jgi:hypothetical protein
MKQPNVILALGPDSTEKTRWPCHKDILQTSSVYFQAIFSSQFQETDASIVFLPRGIFSSEVLDDVIHYLYHNAIKADHQKSDMERLEQLEAIYCAADYLSIEDLCNAAVKQISELAHGLTCSCHGCISLIPQLVLFTGPRYDDPRLTKMTDSILKLYTNDPEKALASLWISPNSIILFSDLTVHQYLEDEILLHISKNNAIETLHGCFLADQVQHQGRPLQVDSTIIKIREKGAQLVADHFDFYCTKYPKLLSCVDGITYSFEFLEYLLQFVTRDKIKVTNACSLYKGVVRSLMSRVAVQTRTQQLLKATKNRIINYIATHLEEIKAVKPIDKTIIESLAQGNTICVCFLMYQLS